MAEQVELWTKDQQDEITDLYGKLKGRYEREAHKELFGGSERPYVQARSILENLIEQQSRESGLEKQMNQTVQSAKGPFASLFEEIGNVSSNPIAATIAILLALYIGLPPYAP